MSAAPAPQPLPAAPRRRRRPRKTARHTIAGARSMLKGIGLRISTEMAAADQDSDAPFELLADLAGLHEVIADQEAVLVRAMRSEPHNYSWAEIGALVGVTGEAARKRWRHLDAVNPRQPGGQPGRLR